MTKIPFTGPRFYARQFNGWIRLVDAADGETFGPAFRIKDGGRPVVYHWVDVLQAYYPEVASAA